MAFVGDVCIRPLIAVVSVTNVMPSCDEMRLRGTIELPAVIPCQWALSPLSAALQCDLVHLNLLRHQRRVPVMLS